MSKETEIQWCDSSVNLQMGCDGCELWTPLKKICYAGKLTDRMEGLPGWPDSFAEPKIFPERMDPAIKWKDLTGTIRENKPWLNGLPRIVFMNDMGDTFSKKLDLMWMAPFMDRMAASPHQWLILTKRPSRFAEFSKRNALPENVWPGTSVTSNLTIGRIRQLAEVRGGGPKFVSVEPMWEQINFDAEPTAKDMQWIILGGESGDNAPATRKEWFSSGIQFCRENGISPFVKQTGTFVESGGRSVRQADFHGGNMREWPEEIRVRETPKIRTGELNLI